MTRKILIPLLLASVFLLSAETTNTNKPEPRRELTTINYEIAKKAIEARCYANETSKSKQDFLIFVENLTPQEKEVAKKLVE